MDGTSQSERPGRRCHHDALPDVNRYPSIPALIDAAIEQYPRRPSFSEGGRVLTFAELGRASDAFAAFLQSDDARLKQGARIAIMLPNVLAYPVVLLGALKAGLVVVNVNPLYTARELRHQLGDSGAEALVVFGPVSAV
ncbi:MAG: AMP-binding protein, partial [Gammaproteobacteria bacterium]|nr:AMP-binding protein [Gammaproteobacteria bacterium]